MKTNISLLAHYAVEHHLTPGLNLGYFDGHGWSGLSVGILDSIEESQVTTPETLYDLASLTKPILATVILREISSGRLDLDTVVNPYLPYFHHLPPISVSSLLSHRSGLQVKTKYDKFQSFSREQAYNILYNPENLTLVHPGAVCYSDLNYLYLGDFLTSLTNLSLPVLIAQFCQTYFRNQAYFQPKNLSLPLAHAERTISHGLPQDEKSRWLGGITGHAGLFGNLNFLEEFTQGWIQNTFQFSAQDYEQAYQTLPHPEHLEHSFGLVWKHGKYGPDIAYHSGFSGCTILINRRNSTAICYTCNNCYPVRTSEIYEAHKELRSQFAKILE
jgi:CubicO group peptidase (beta-lactamase class C family)